jgi:hypothetical protein
LGADGKSAGGLDIKILGGRHGDIPLEAGAGALIARTVVETGISVILDLSHLTKQRQEKFVTDFSLELMERRKRDPAAMHIVWEEAYRFMPQRMTKGSKSEMLEATEELVTMGRNFGIGGTIICQRAAQVSKTVLTQASILIAMNTTGLLDKKVIESWMDLHSLGTELPRLSELKKGEGFVWWPEELGIVRKVKILKKTTFDASSTPKFGEKTRRRKLKTIDMAALEVSMAETIEKVKSSDPKLLKKRIAELEAQLAKAPTAEVKVKEVPAVDEATMARFEAGVESLRSIADRITENLPIGVGPHASSRAEILRMDAHLQAIAARRQAQSAAPTKTEPFRAPAKLILESTGGTGGQVALAKGAVGMLKALAAIYPGGLSKKQVALSAGLKASGGTFGTYWSKLNVLGFIEGSGSLWHATAAGMDFLGTDIPDKPVSSEEKLDFWCARVPGRAKDMLRYIHALDGACASKTDLGNQLGLEPTGGTMGTYISKLASNNLIVKTREGYCISPEMF